MFFRKNTPQGMKACNPLPPVNDIPVDASVSDHVITRVVNLITYQVPVAGIRDLLLMDGLSEYECFLAYKAAKLYLNQVGE
jgi:hypothetical protein